MTLVKPATALDEWFARAGAAIASELRPGSIVWTDDSSASLFALESPGPSRGGVAVPPLFARLARSVACHSDPARWDALYVVLWRIAHGEPALLEILTDPMVHRLVQMHRAVKRESHKMKAFLRFRRIDEGDRTRYVAWFEPAHSVVERTAPFFARRFPSMRWSILTPNCCAHWDERQLTFTPGVRRDDAPRDDALEDLWRTYYVNIFNPARLNGQAMRAEMPVRYWRNLPEATTIRPLQASARRRVDEMLSRIAAEPEPLPVDLRPTPAEIALVAALDRADDRDPVHDPGAREAKRRADRVSAHDRFARRGETQIDLGVAGWTDPTLLAPGVFYPAGCTSPEDRLRYYASRFSMVEVDATYYALPTRAMATAWAARTPDAFTFDVKAHALMTGHPTDIRRLPDWVRRALPARKSGDARLYARELPEEILDEVWRRFRDALAPLRAAGKLGALMLQYPRWFLPTRESADALRRARDYLGDDLATVELRHCSWMEGRLAPRTIALLSELGFSYVVVDAPPGMESSMPPTVAVTNPKLVVFRLHGRRVETWEARNDPVTERYRYLYDREQLLDWLPRVSATAFNVARVHMTFNNNHANYATTNAAEMAQIFRES